MEKEIAILKSYFTNKASQGEVSINGECVLTAFNMLIATIQTPKNVWIEHNGLDKPTLLQEWFGMVEFRDGEKRLCCMASLPSYMWIHSEKPETMASNSIEKRRKWNNQIVKYYIQEYT